MGLKLWVLLAYYFIVVSILQLNSGGTCENKNTYAFDQTNKKFYFFHSFTHQSDEKVTFRAKFERLKNKNGFQMISSFVVAQYDDGGDIIWKKDDDITGAHRMGFLIDPEKVTTHFMNPRDAGFCNPLGIWENSYANDKSL